MSNEIKCNIKEPHSHLVHGQTFECEKGQPDNNMSQPQLSVREKAREMFDKEFGYKSLDFHDDYDGDGWNGASMVKSTGCDDCARCQNAREAHKNFIDQIITLAQEEKIKEVEKLTWVVYPDQADGEILVEQKGYNSALQDVINILKQ